MVCHTFTSCLDAFSSRLVLVEASQQNSLPQILVTGLPNTVVQESKERIKSSLNQLGFKTPTKKSLIHLSPAEIKKIGSHFDLPMAMALLSLEGYFPATEIKTRAFLGELSPSGRVHKVNHLIPLLERLVEEESIQEIFVPRGNLSEASVFKCDKIRFCDHLKEVISTCFLKERSGAALETGTSSSIPSPPPSFSSHSEGPHLVEMVGQEQAKKCLVLSLAGQLPLLVEGPPGSGKTHLAHCAPALLPDLNEKEQIEVSKIYSFIGENRVGNFRPPFRSPHHSISASAFLGGGQGTIHPGEITLSHHGLLFLDEFPEFRRDAIEGLREPIQNGEIHLNRISKNLRLPAHFRLIAVMNPCPCGYFQSQKRKCSCSENQIRNYRKKISGPILDRFPLYLWMESEITSHGAVLENKLEKQPARNKIRDQISLIQEQLRSCPEAPWSEGAKKWWRQTERFHTMSYRRKINLEKVAYTLSLFEGNETINKNHLDEAWTLRSPENLFQNF